MKIKQFTKTIGGYSDCRVLLRNPNAEFFSMHTFFDEKTPEPDIIYICFLEELARLESNLPLNLLCRMSSPDEKIPVKIQEAYPNSNFILLYTEHDEKWIYDLVGRSFTAEIRYSHQMAQLMECSAADKGLQALVNELYHMIHCPIILIDTSYRILAMYQPDEDDMYYDLEENRRIGYLTERTLARLKRDRIYDKIRESGTNFVYFKPEDEDYSWYNTLIRAYGVEVAEIGILERTKFTEFDFQLFRYFSQIITWEMEKENFFTPNKGLMHSIFLSELLEQKFVTSEAVNRRKNMLGWPDSNGYNVLTVFSDEPAGFRNRAEIFALNVQHLIPHVRWLINDTNMIFLIASDTDEEQPYRPGSVLSDLFRYNHMYGILSNYFTDLKNMKKYHRQTLEVREFTKTEKSKTPILFYAEYAISHMAKILEETHPLEDFYHPLITKIAAYDSENKTEYLETLYQYLLNTDNPTLCAKNLCIHKNTYFYRMNRIKEIFGMNLSRGKELSHLLITLEFMKLKNRI